MSNAPLKQLPVFHTGPDGRIVRAPRVGDGYSVVREGWHVTTADEMRAKSAPEPTVSAPIATTAAPLLAEVDFESIEIGEED